MSGGAQFPAAECRFRESPGLRKWGFTQVTARSGTNALGVHDLEGNVSEWTGTESRPGEFIIRAIQQQDGVGFRVVIELANPP